jgi:hypothetical protein
LIPTQQLTHAKEKQACYDFLQYVFYYFQESQWPTKNQNTMCDLDAASNKGFKLIADYIFGNNKARTGASEKISMTVPVTMEPKSEKISMTAPVSMQETSGKWRMHFVMPSKYTLETLPKPNNAEVKLREVPAKKYAVIQFSGLAGEEKVAKKTEELFTWLQAKQIKPAGAPELARYNSPWTLPFLRRNEVMVEYQ